MKKLNKNSRGFALSEAIVALSIIAIISFATLSLFLSSYNATKNAIDKSRAQNITEAIIECYRITDSEADFNSALDFSLGDLDREGCRITWGATEIDFTVTVGKEEISKSFRKAGGS